MRHLTIGHGGNYELLYDQWRAKSYSDFHHGARYGWGEMEFWRDAYSLLVRRSVDSAVIDSLVAARDAHREPGEPQSGGPTTAERSRRRISGVAYLSLGAWGSLLAIAACYIVRRQKISSRDDQ